MNGYIAGITISPDSGHADFYMILFGEENDSDFPPVTRDGYAVLFKNRLDAPRVLKSLGLDEAITLVSIEEHVSVDINNVFYILEEQSEDTNSTLLDFYNTFFDICSATKFVIPYRTKKLLWQFANYLTTEKDLNPFFADNMVSRKRVIDASLWLVGALFARATFYESRTDQAST